MMRRANSRSGSRPALWLIGVFLAASTGWVDDKNLVPASERAQLDSAFFWDDVDSAITFARGFTVRYPDDPSPWHDLGRLLARTQRADLLPEAEQALLTCLALNPPEPWMTVWCHVVLGDVYFRTDRDSVATEHCERAIELNATVNATRNARRLLARNRTSDAGYEDWTVFDTEHFQIHLSSYFTHPDSKAHFAGEYESAYRRLKRFWGVEPEGPVHLYIYSADEMETQAAMPAHHAFPERREIHTSGNAAPGHELTHVFAYVVNPNQRSALLVEGVAKVLDQVRTPFATDCEAFEAVKGDSAVSLAEISRSFDYRNDYLIAASFVTHVIREYGAERFLALYRSEEPLEKAMATAFGVSLAEVEAAWKQRLSGMDAILADLLAIGPVKDDPEKALPLVDRVLAAYGDVPDLMAYKARLLVKAARYEEAITAARVAAATQDDATIGLGVAREAHIHWADALAALGKPEEARAHFQAVIEIGAADNWTDAARRKLAALDRQHPPSGP